MDSELLALDRFDLFKGVNRDQAVIDFAETVPAIGIDLLISTVLIAFGLMDIDTANLQTFSGCWCRPTTQSEPDTPTAIPVEDSVIVKPH